MENNQSKSSELSDSKLVPSSRTRSNNLNSLLVLLKHYPWLTWVGVWILLLGITAISILSLTHPINLQQEPEPTIATTETSSDSASPMWLLGAVLIATGSFVIFKRLKSGSESAKHKPSFGRSLTRRQQRKLLLQGHLAPTQPEPPPAAMLVQIEPVVNLPLKDHLPDAGELLAVPDDLPASDLIANYLDAESEPVVTVLPPEEVGEKQESLAEMMDIRKYRSLASILQNEE
jgi:hypothetical protein